MTVFLVGVASARPDAFAAKVGFAVGALAYGCGLLLPWQLHFLDLFTIGLALALLAVGLATWAPALRRGCRQEPTPPVRSPIKHQPVVDVAQWLWVRRLCAGVAALVAALTVSLQFGSLELFIAFGVVWVALALVLAALRTTDVRDVEARGVPHTV
mmetsp:Transcript_8947/g.27158  ORF Transcript_8947/g.27158 Transcript_8947/m.27158 type:complete len:156 (-) Transcript_8947:15-482(-)